MRLKKNCNYKTSKIASKNSDGIKPFLTRINRISKAEIFKEHFFFKHFNLTLAFCSHTNTNTVEEYFKFLFHSGFCPVKYLLSNSIKSAINEYSLKKSSEDDLITADIYQKKLLFIFLIFLILF